MPSGLVSPELCDGVIWVGHWWGIPNVSICRSLSIACLESEGLVPSDGKGLGSALSSLGAGIWSPSASGLGTAQMLTTVLHSRDPLLF